MVQHDWGYEAGLQVEQTTIAFAICIAVTPGYSGMVSRVERKSNTGPLGTSFCALPASHLCG